MSQGLESVVRQQLGKSMAVMQAVMDDPQIAATLVQAAEMTAAAMKAGRKLIVCGNGGSAADSQHLVAEFISRLTINRPALRAIALTTDSSILTAIGNDFSFDYVFERQVEALGQAGDVFLGVSTSGNSKNVLQAARLCRTMGITTIGLTGNGGGALAQHCELNLIIPSAVTMNIQESHLALEHIFCMLVELCYFGPDFAKQPQHLAE